MSSILVFQGLPFNIDNFLVPKKKTVDDFFQTMKHSSVTHIISESLRSQNKQLVHQPHFHLKSYGQRELKTSAPCLWNELPYNIKNSININDFMKKLKMHL